MQKTILPPETFLIDAYSQDFISGKRPYINTSAANWAKPTGPQVAWIVIGLLVTLGGVVAYAAMQINDVGLAGILLGALVAVPMAIPIWLNALRKRKYEQEGKIIPAELIEITGKKTVSSEGPSGYFVTVKYKFLSPGGKTIENKLYRLRNDLVAVELPPPGTPLAVLYLSDRTYRLL